MRREWEPEDLIAAWTVLDGDWELVGNKNGATRLGFALMLKFFEQEARFPRHSGEIPRAAVKHYDATDEVPVKGVVPDGWLEAVVDSGGAIERVSYELCVLVSLKNALRRREIYVAGATRWRNPRRTCRPTSRTTGMCTTRPCASRWTLGSSSPSWGS